MSIWKRELSDGELKAGKLAVKYANDKYGKLRPFMSEGVWEDLVMASAALLVLGQALEKYEPAQRLLYAAMEVVNDRAILEKKLRREL